MALTPLPQLLTGRAIAVPLDEKAIEIIDMAGLAILILKAKCIQLLQLGLPIVKFIPSARIAFVITFFLASLIPNAPVAPLSAIAVPLLVLLVSYGRLIEPKH